MAATLIGTTASYGLSAPSFSVVAAPPELETTEVSIPRPEKRVPGAAFTLPANPLSDLDADDLASFVEFQLLETEGADSAAVNISGKVNIGSAPPEAASPAPVAAAPAAVAGTLSRPALSAAARREQRIEQALEIARRGWPYASCLMLGLIFGLAMRSGSKAARPVRAPAPAVAPVALAAPPSAPSPAIEPPPVAPAAPAPAARKATASVPGDCTASVKTTPRDATVMWGDVALGPGPIGRASIPCGKAVVTIQHDRYEDVTRTMTAKPGQMAALSERMRRPPAKVMITSDPPRAQIKFNGRAIGGAPRNISALRFEHVRVSASLPGYQPWSKKLYLRQADTKIDVELVAVPKPASKRAPPAAAAPRGPAAPPSGGPAAAPAPAARPPVPR
jgi:hypothetical protein